MQESGPERFIELLVFRSRWVLAPAYLVLVGGLCVLAFDTLVEFVQFVRIVWGSIAHGGSQGIFNETAYILQILTIVDLVLILNLILMVIFVGYVNFVSQIHPDKVEDWPDWIRHIDYSGLKLKLMGSVIAIASIKMLRLFVEISDTRIVDYDKTLWMTILYGTFLGGSLVLAIINRLEPEPGKRGSQLRQDMRLTPEGASYPYPSPEER